MTFRPMLSADLKKPENIRFPVMVSPKLDGIRCLVIDGELRSRTLKPIPNAHINKVLEAFPFPFDGELIVGDPNNPLTWNETQSGVMSRDGEPDFIYHVFDHHTPQARPFAQRFDDVHRLHASLPDFYKRFIKVVPHEHVTNLEGLVSWENNYVGAGYEGLMIRSLDGHYKWGRSTEKQGGLIKMKRFHDAEARIVGFVERMHNENEQTRDNLGLAKRSTHKANKTPMGTLGAFVCEILASKLDSTLPDVLVEFEVGTGMDDSFRQYVWDNQALFLNKMLKFKYQQVTNKMKPRLPVYLGIREDE